MLPLTRVIIIELMVNLIELLDKKQNLLLNRKELYRSTSGKGYLSLRIFSFLGEFSETFFKNATT